MEKGFKIELKCRYEAWWRYNAALMCGCFDADDRRTGFVSAASEVAEVGANLPAKPDGLPDRNCVALETPPCDHILLYAYIIPHTLPEGNDIDATRPFDIEIRLFCAGRLLRTEKRKVNQWSGASIELKAAKQSSSQEDPAAK
ncbi:hypothetical protein [uncultured Alistipes sp.]|uniref:hypothetical protein n=1 Tax=uncultured Alistipes sp. TaxID=538949 RepID=UPI002638DC50|nr:hypothetical protein [uncultured Alistipes sp.]